MRAYTGQTRDRRMVQELAAAGIGEICQPWEFPPRRLPFALDNGAFTAWQAGTRNDWVGEWWQIVQRLGPGECDFAVIPDAPTDARTTIEWAHEWGQEMRDYDVSVPCFVAVQDGMIPEDLLTLPCAFGVFVGGSTRWKWATAAQWVGFGRAYGKPVHIGRVSTVRRVRLARDLGADSIDSSFPLWTRARLREWIEAVQGQPAKQRQLFKVA